MHTEHPFSPTALTLPPKPCASWDFWRSKFAYFSSWSQICSTPYEKIHGRTLKTVPLYFTFPSTMLQKNSDCSESWNPTLHLPSRIVISFNPVALTHETHWGGYFLRTNFSLRTKIRIFERRFEFEDCICFNRNSIKSNGIQAAGENCRKSAATAARAPDGQAIAADLCQKNADLCQRDADLCQKEGFFLFFQLICCIFKVVTV